MQVRRLVSNGAILPENARTFKQGLPRDDRMTCRPEPRDAQIEHENGPELPDRFLP
jgi:hypothetical protein